MPISLFLLLRPRATVRTSNPSILSTWTHHFATDFDLGLVRGCNRTIELIKRPSGYRYDHSNFLFFFYVRGEPADTGQTAIRITPIEQIKILSPKFFSEFQLTFFKSNLYFNYHLYFKSYGFKFIWITAYALKKNGLLFLRCRIIRWGNVYTYWFR